MITKVHFQNFKALRDATLPLAPLTLIVGPNGSGKSTALQGLQTIGQGINLSREDVGTAGLADNISGEEVQISVQGEVNESLVAAVWTIRKGIPAGWNLEVTGDYGPLVHLLSTMRIYAFSASAIMANVVLQPHQVLNEDGSGLAGVLDRLRDQSPERFESLNDELPRWLPEFDRVLFETPSGGLRSLMLRNREGHSIRARNLSHGTLFALAIMTLAHAPSTPALIGIEEAEHGMHPRLLRDVYDALFRLANPEAFGLSSEARQVIVTTHSPYLLDFFRDHPESVVIAEKSGPYATFERLSDRKDIEEILGDVTLGDAWYTGVLGGVPTER